MSTNNLRDAVDSLKLAGGSSDPFHVCGGYSHGSHLVCIPCQAVMISSGGRLKDDCCSRRWKFDLLLELTAQLHGSNSATECMLLGLLIMLHSDLARQPETNALGLLGKNSIPNLWTWLLWLLWERILELRCWFRTTKTAFGSFKTFGANKCSPCSVNRNKSSSFIGDSLLFFALNTLAIARQCWQQGWFIVFDTIKTLPFSESPASCRDHDWFADRSRPTATTAKEWSLSVCAIRRESARLTNKFIIRQIDIGKTQRWKTVLRLRSLYLGRFNSCAVFIVQIINAHGCSVSHMDHHETNNGRVE